MAVMGFAPGFAYLDGLPEPFRGVPRRPRRARSSRPARWRWPTGTPPSTRRLHPVAGSSSAGPRPPSSPPPPLPTPRWRRATRCSWSRRRWTASPDRARASPPCLVAAPRGARRAGGGSAGSAGRAPGRGPPGGGGHRRPRRGPGRSGVVFCWPTGWWATARTPARWRSPPGRHGCAVSNRVTSRWWAGGPASSSTVPSKPAGQVVPLVAGQLLEVGPMRRGLPPYVAVAGGLLGPEVFGSMASDELSGLGPGPLGRGRAVARRAVGAAAGRPPGGRRSPRGATGGRPARARVLPGPHPAWFAPDVAATTGDAVLRGGRTEQPHRPPAPTRQGRRASPGRRGRRRGSRLSRHRGGRAPGAARWRTGRAHARPRHARGLPGGGRRRPRPTTGCSVNAVRGPK